MNQREVLTQALRDNRLAILCGAGVSISLSDDSDLASWKGFLSRAVDFCFDHAPDELGDPSQWRDVMTRLLALGTTEAYLGVASYVRRILDKKHRGLFAKFLNETIGTLELRNAPLQAAFATLRTSGALIATTNYDELLCSAGTRAISMSDPRLPDILRNAPTSVIFHLHGIWRDPEGLVLDWGSYEREQQDRLQDVLKAVFLSRQVLLVGFGAGADDPTFERLLDFLERFVGKSWADIRFACRTSEVAGLKSRLSTLGMSPMPYGDSYDELPMFLYELQTNGAHSTGRLRAAARWWRWSLTVGARAAEWEPHQLDKFEQRVEGELRQLALNSQDTRTWVGGYRVSEGLERAASAVGISTSDNAFHRQASLTFEVNGVVVRDDAAGSVLETLSTGFDRKDGESAS